MIFGSFGSVHFVYIKHPVQFLLQGLSSSVNSDGLIIQRSRVQVQEQAKMFSMYSNEESNQKVNNKNKNTKLFVLWSTFGLIRSKHKVCCCCSCSGH